ncbi:MAG: hypothetical protein JRH20_00215 [Deltaproteobacteria bacterium]|nr:hypothetical protein [Deltaproteobacteria bacterium]
MVTLLLFASTSSTAWATNFRLNTSTHVRGYVLPGANDTSHHVPFYELIGLRADDLGVQGLSLVASLWGQVHLNDVPLDEQRANGDVNVFLLSYRAHEKGMFRGLQLRVGRQFVSAGPSVYEQLDGGYVHYRSPFGLDVTAFGGVPTGIRFLRQSWPTNANDYKYGGNWVVGGRVGYRFKEFVGAGVSFRHKAYDAHTAFQELGWDAAVHPNSKLTIFSDGTFSMIAERLKEARGGVRFDLRRNLSLMAGYRFSEPDLFIPRTSIFSIFSDIKHQEAFLESYWSPKRWLSLSAEAGGRYYGETCNLKEYGGQSCDDGQLELRGLLRADARFGLERRYRVSALVERVGAPDGGYIRGRVGGSARLVRGLSATVDVDLFYLDARDEVASYVIADDSRLSFTGAAYLGYAIRDNLTLMAGGQAGVTPLLAQMGTFMVRLSWDIDSNPTGGPVRVSRSASPSFAYLPGGAL